jgi:hypothetical protein
MAVGRDDARKRDEFVSGFEQQIAMWADESLFGHGLDDDAYEQLCDGFAEEFSATAFRVLVERPVR